MSRTVADLLVGVLERLKPAFHRTRPQRPRPYWLGDTFEVLGSEVLQLEQIAEQFSCALGAHCRRGAHRRLISPKEMRRRRLSSQSTRRTQRRL